MTTCHFPFILFYMKKERLPVYEKKEEILQAVKQHDTVILTAETGSGKSTQVPRFLYGAGYEVIVTQPRRLACVTLAERVAEEMGGSKVVGYQTAFESTRTAQTKILFCTDGLQMARGIRDFKNTVLILDEVHEWNLNIETLAAWVRKYRRDGNRLKVVLMSATIDALDLEQFYRTSSSVQCIRIEGKAFHVEKRHAPENAFCASIAQQAREGHNVLAFVPGKKEIDETIAELRRDRTLRAQLLPLHGELTSGEQKKCFRLYEIPKIIVSTNVAQTSVTIPDIDCVVDQGTEKRVEIEGGIEGLFLRDISRADCLQRAGRAGRTKDGIYILCAEHGIEKRESYSRPEITRMVLDKVVLKLASVDIDAEEMEFCHQPDLSSIQESKRTLRFLGALRGNRITDTGKRMIRMPVSVRFAKMLLAAEKAGCVADMIKAVSILENGSLLGYKEVLSRQGIEKIPMKYSDFVRESRSDVLAEVRLYKAILAGKYPDLMEAGIHKKNYYRAKDFVFKLTKDLRGQFDVDSDRGRDFDLVKCVIAGIADHLYESGRKGCRDSEGKEYKLSRESCVKPSYPYLFGLPRIISYEDSRGRGSEMSLITMASGVTLPELLEIFSENPAAKALAEKNAQSSRGGKSSKADRDDRKHPRSRRRRTRAVRTVTTPSRRKELRARMPKGSSDDARQIASELLPQVGARDFDFPEYGVTGTKYFGLVWKDNEAGFQMYESESEASEATERTLKEALRRLVRTEMGEKTFILRRAGMRFETESSKAAAHEFQTMAEEIIGEATAEGFAESLDFLCEVYEDCRKNCRY